MFLYFACIPLLNFHHFLIFIWFFLFFLSFLSFFLWFSFSAFLEEIDKGAHVDDPFDLCGQPDKLTDTEQIRKIFETNVERARQSDVVVAYIPSASMGTGLEIENAYKNGKIVYTVSPLTSNWVIRLYSTKVFNTIEDFKKFYSEEFPKGTIPQVKEEKK